jgi:hypothetical protein
LFSVIPVINHCFTFSCAANRTEEKDGELGASTHTGHTQLIECTDALRHNRPASLAQTKLACPMCQAEDITKRKKECTVSVGSPGIHFATGTNSQTVVASISTRNRR